LLNADEVDQSTRRATPGDSTRTVFARTNSGTALNRTAESDRDSEVTRTTVTRTTAADAVGTATAVPTTIGTGPGRNDPLDRIEIGQRIDDFDLLTSLGSGAFARVFLARQRSLQRLVAVKISSDHGTEPQTLAQLDHDYIVRVFDQRLLDE